MIATRGFVSDLKLLLCDVHYTTPIHPLSAMSSRSNSDVRRAEVDIIQYSNAHETNAQALERGSSR